MEVILLERLGRLGSIGDVVSVRDGYARNFLIPQAKALRATAANKQVFEAKRQEIEAASAERIAAAEAQVTKLKDISLSLVRQASQEGKLYGSITVRDIAEALEQAGSEVPKSQIVLTSTIRNTGDYDIKIALHPEVSVTLNLAVKRIESEAA